jgi:hypothetical protein
MEVFKHGESGGSFGVGDCSWEPAGSQELHCVIHCGLAVAKVKTNGMNAVTLDDSEVVVECRLWADADFGGRVSKLYTKPKIPKRFFGEEFSIPLLRKNESVRY